MRLNSSSGMDSSSRVSYASSRSPGYPNGGVTVESWPDKKEKPSLGLSPVKLQDQSTPHRLSSDGNQSISSSCSSDSCSCDSCSRCSSSTAAWLDHVTEDGHLFFLEPSTKEEYLLGLDQLKASDASDVLTNGGNQTLPRGTKKTETHEGVGTRLFGSLKRNKKREQKGKSRGDGVWEKFELSLHLTYREGYFPWVECLPDSSLNLTEKILGLSFEHELSKSSRRRAPKEDRIAKDIVRVATVLDDSPAHFGGVRVGDEVVCIENIPVTTSGVEGVVSSIRNRRKVTMIIFRESTSSKCSPSATSGQEYLSHHLSSVLLSVVSGNAVPQQIRDIISEPHAVLFLSSESSSTDPLYVFSNVNDARLLRLKGVFLTLQGLCPDITASRPRVVTLSLDNRSVVKVACSPGEGSKGGLFLLALPSTGMSCDILVSCATRLHRLLCWWFGSLQRAFESPSHRNMLNRLFASFFLRVLYGRPPSPSVPHPHQSKENGRRRWPSREPPPAPLPPPSCSLLESGMISPLLAPIGKQLKLRSRCYLLDYLSGSWDYGLFPEPEWQRGFVVRHASLFHRGLLVCDVGPERHLEGTHAFLSQLQVLPLSACGAIAASTIWEPIHPDDPTKERNHFFIAVVQTYTVFTAVLSSGPHTVSWAEGDGPCAPYLDQAFLLLEDLRADEVIRAWDAAFEDYALNSVALLGFEDALKKKRNRSIRGGSLDRNRTRSLSRDRGNDGASVIMRSASYGELTFRTATTPSPSPFRSRSQMAAPESPWSQASSSVQPVSWSSSEEGGRGRVRGRREERQIFQRHLASAASSTTLLEADRLSDDVSSSSGATAWTGGGRERRSSRGKRRHRWRTTEVEAIRPLHSSLFHFLSCSPRHVRWMSPSLLLPFLPSSTSDLFPQGQIDREIRELFLRFVVEQAHPQEKTELGHRFQVQMKNRRFNYWILRRMSSSPAAETSFISLPYDSPSNQVVFAQFGL